MELSSYYQGVFLNSQNQQWTVKAECEASATQMKLCQLPETSPVNHQDCSGFSQYPAYSPAASPSYPSYTPYAYHYSCLSPPAYPHSDRFWRHANIVMLNTAGRR